VTNFVGVVCHFVISCLSFSSIFGFSPPLWYLQTLPTYQAYGSLRSAIGDLCQVWLPWLGFLDPEDFTYLIYYPLTLSVHNEDYCRHAYVLCIFVWLLVFLILKELFQLSFHIHLSSKLLNTKTIIEHSYSRFGSYNMECSREPDTYSL
jgi:hypothetical protein